jgi:hypothetical protein
LVYLGKCTRHQSAFALKAVSSTSTVQVKREGSRNGKEGIPICVLRSSACCVLSCALTLSTVLASTSRKACKTMAYQSMKCVVVGSNGSGKTSLVLTYTTGSFPSMSMQFTNTKPYNLLQLHLYLQPTRTSKY